MPDSDVVPPDQPAPLPDPVQHPAQHPLQRPGTHRARGRARAALRDVLPAASVALAHLGRDRTVVTARALRALPAPVRSVVARTLGRTTSALGALALGADSRTAQAEATLARLRERGPRHARSAAVAAVALHRADAALAALARVPAGTPGRPRAAALVAAERGFLRDAVAELGGEARTGVLARDLAGDLALLTTGRLPARRTPPVAPGSRGADRVLHLVTNALPEVQAGYTTRTHGIAAAQAERGQDVHVATRLGFPVTAGHLGAPGSLLLDGVRYERLLPARPLPRRADDRLAADVTATVGLARRLRPDVLHAHSRFVNADVALHVGARLDLPVVYEVRGFLEETWRSRGADPAADLYVGARARETEVMLAADAVVTISAGMRDQVVARGVPEGRVHVVANAVDDRFVGPAPDPAALRDRLGIASDEIVVGTVTTVNDYEGVDVLVDAVARLRARGLPVRLLVVGSGPGLARVRDVAARLLGTAALVVGRVPFADVPRWHAAIDVFAVPRLDLPVTAAVTPIKPLEAFATGRPVVASDLPALHEIVTPERGGFATPGDAHDLADALETFVTHDDARRAAGAAGRAWVLAERTWRQAAARYADLYRGL